MRRTTPAQVAESNSSDKRYNDVPAFPAKQLFILACCRICEPIAFMSIFPYIAFMVRDFNITTDESKISVYAGMITSAFTLAEFSTGFLWGRLSDAIGRKPVLLCGLAGTAVSALLFGFAPSFPVALFARALGGLLNGNIGVLQTTVAELVTVREQQPRAYTIMPMVWCIGSVIGPMIGGALAQPCENFPSLFPRGTIWDRFPYLLPNLFSAVAVFVGVIVGLLFLEETHAVKRLQRDRGLELGNRLTALLFGSGTCQGRSPEKQGLLAGEDLPNYSAIGTLPSSDNFSEADETLPEYRSRESSPGSANRKRQGSPMTETSLETGFVTEPRMKIFTKPVILNIISYGILAFHTMTFDQLFPVFLSMSRRDHPISHLPFKFVDGFAFSSSTVGIIMAVQGAYSLFSNYVFVAPVTRRLGSLRLFRFLAFSYFSLYVITPYLVLLPSSMAMGAIYLLVMWKCTFSTMAYPSNAILLANSAPSKQVLGTINGVAASTASLCRALGPLVSGFFFATGVETGYSGLAWWVCALITLLGAFLSSRITEHEPPPSLSDDVDFNDAMISTYGDEESV